MTPSRDTKEEGHNITFLQEKDKWFEPILQIYRVCLTNGTDESKPMNHTPIRLSKSFPTSQADINCHLGRQISISSDELLTFSLLVQQTSSSEPNSQNLDQTPNHGQPAMEFEVS